MTESTAIDTRSEKKSAEQDVTDRMTAVYEAATEEERTRVQEMVKRALGSAHAVEIVEFTPGMAARLFFDHNKQNRKWDHVTSRNYAEAMAAGLWEFTNQGIGFLTTGDVGDGQYRLAGIVLAGVPVKLVVTYGLAHSAIEVIDSGKPRVAADALHIDHMEDAARKAAILKTAWSCLARGGDPTKKLRARDNRAVVAAVKEHSRMLDEAMRLGEESVKGTARPTLGVKDAQTFAFLLLKTAWPFSVIMDKLELFQRGQDVTGESSPFFVTAKLLDRESTRREARSTSARLAASVKAFLLDEEGIKAVKANVIRDVMKPKLFPNPSYVQLKDKLKK